MSLNELGVAAGFPKKLGWFCYNIELLLKRALKLATSGAADASTKDRLCPGALAILPRPVLVPGLFLGCRRRGTCEKSAKS